MAPSLALKIVDASKRYCADFGLSPVERGSAGLNAEALDGTHLVVRAASDTSLPASIAPPPNLRETLWGVRDKSVIDAIGGELSKDRQVKLGTDGVLRSYDDSGYPIAFQLSSFAVLQGRADPDQRSRISAATRTQSGRMRPERTDQAAYIFAHRLFRAGSRQGRALLCRAARLHRH